MSTIACFARGALLTAAFLYGSSLAADAPGGVEAAPGSAPQNESPAALEGIRRFGAQAYFTPQGRVWRIELAGPFDAHERAPRFLAELEQLREIYVSQAAGDPRIWIDAVVSLPRLEKVATYQVDIDDAGLAGLGAIKSLRVLRIEGSQVSDAGLEKLLPLANLEELSIRRGEITNAGLKTLAKFRGLKRLTLEETKITPEGLSALYAARIEEFHWWDARRSQRQIIPYLGKFPHLRVFDMQVQGITDDDLKHLAGAVNLETVNLSRNKITDAGVAHLAGLKKLRDLNLGGDDFNGQMRITDAGLAHLAGLTQIQRLDLHGSQVTADGLAKLRGLSELEFLEISDTPLRRAELIDLRPFKKLRTVNAYDFDEAVFRLPANCSVVTFD